MNSIANETSQTFGVPPSGGPASPELSLRTFEVQPPAIGPHPVTRQGKIARLPAAIRSRVCQMMHEGIRYTAIIAWLAENGHPGLLKCNLTRWRKGGYQDWFHAQQWLEQSDFKRQLAVEQAKTDDPVFHDAGVYLAQIQFYEALNRLEGAELSQLVRKHPKEFIQLLKTFTHFNRYCLHRDKFRNDLRRQDQAGHLKGKSPRQPFRKVTLDKICVDQNLI